jgi:hypothetical protein
VITINELVKLLVVILFIGVCVKVVDLELTDVQIKLDSAAEEVRAHNTPTRYEYKVLSIEYITPWIGNNYYNIRYIGVDNIVSSKQFNDNDGLRMILSNETKFVIENPENNGYKYTTTLYRNESSNIGDNK